MATTLAEAIRVLQKHAENDAALAETIRLLAEDGDGPDEPFADPGQAVRGVACLVNERRQGERRAAFLNRTIDTADVIELIKYQANLEALGLDDRVSTGRVAGDRDENANPLLDTCGRLIDALYVWRSGQAPSIVYCARTTPAARNIAFTDAAEPKVHDVGRLRDATALHAHLVLRAGFTVPNEWLA